MTGSYECDNEPSGSITSGESSLPEDLLAAQEGLWPMETVVYTNQQVQLR